MVMTAGLLAFGMVADRCPIDLQAVAIVVSSESIQETGRTIPMFIRSFPVDAVG